MNGECVGCDLMESEDEVPWWDHGKLQVRVCFASWSTSREKDSDEFYDLLMQAMPDGTLAYGVRGRCEDNRVQYVVVIRVCRSLRLRVLEDKLRLERRDGVVDTRLVGCHPLQGGRRREFLKRLCECCTAMKEQVLFGVPFTYGVLSDWRLDEILLGKTTEGLDRVCESLFSLKGGCNKEKVIDDVKDSVVDDG